MKTSPAMPLALTALSALVIACTTSAGTPPGQNDGDAGADASNVSDAGNTTDAGAEDADASGSSDASTVTDASNPYDYEASVCPAAIPSPDATCELCLEQTCCPQSQNCELLMLDGGINGCQAIQTCVTACWTSVEFTDGGSITVCQDTCEGEFPGAAAAYVHWLSCKTSCATGGC